MKIDSGKNRLGSVLERFQNDVIAGVAQGGGAWFVYKLNGDKIRFIYGIKWVIRCANCEKCT